MIYFKIKRVYYNGFSKQFYTKLKIDKIKFYEIKSLSYNKTPISYKIPKTGSVKI